MSKTQEELTTEAVCESCGTKENISFGPCPFASEINEDYTEIWLCEECSYERAMEI
jgi:hypothetical protein